MYTHTKRISRFRVGVMDKQSNRTNECCRLINVEMDQHSNISKQIAQHSKSVTQNHRKGERYQKLGSNAPSDQSRLGNVVIEYFIK